MSDVLCIENLSKKYPEFTLDHVSFHVKEGSIMGFIGRNGAGKSTTLKALLNFVHPDEGEISFFGKHFEDAEEEIKGMIGFVSGGVNYYAKKKLKTITACTKRFYKSWDEKAYRKYMEMFNLKENKTPDQLSEGMKVKYSLVLALSHHAKLLILDEPTSGLDPISRDDLLDVFLTLVQDEKVSILFSTHVTSDLDKCADDITYIREGKIIASEKFDTFVDTYRVVELSKENVNQEVEKLLIGKKRSKHGFTALVRKEDADKIPYETTEADIDGIMVHLDKDKEESPLLTEGSHPFSTKKDKEVESHEEPTL